MNASIIGAGYVGLVTGACLSALGLNVMCMDIDKNKVEQLKNGIVPIYEPGLQKILEDSLFVTRKLSFSSDIAEAVNFSEVIFIAVNTPTLDNNLSDLRFVDQVVQDIAEHMQSYKVIVTKSTVPVGTAKYIKEKISGILHERNMEITFDLVSNPEFLREGCAIEDFMKPDRIVIGAESKKAADIMKNIYDSFISLNIPYIETNTETAELIKYASNAFLATKISFINEMANLCELCGADVKTISKAMGLDLRIGPAFLNPGPGYGGSCFPKDTKALLGIGKIYGYVPKIVKSVVEVNDRQKILMLRKIIKAAGSLKGKVIAILGAAFKAETDDIRESSSIFLIKALLEKKAKVKLYDPQAMDNVKNQHPDLQIDFCDNAYTASENSDCVVLATEWNEFKQIDFQRLRTVVNKPVFVDLRNQHDPELVKKSGFQYIGVGRK